MEKLKLVDGTEYYCANSSANNDSLTVTLSRIADFTALKSKLTRNNLEEIRLISDGGTTGIYEGFIKVSPYTILDNGETMDVTITFSKEDLETKVAALENKIEQYKHETDSSFDELMTEVLPSIEEMITEVEGGE